MLGEIEGLQNNIEKLAGKPVSRILQALLASSFLSASSRKQRKPHFQYCQKCQYWHPGTLLGDKLVTVAESCLA